MSSYSRCNVCYRVRKTPNTSCNACEEKGVNEKFKKLAVDLEEKTGRILFSCEKKLYSYICGQCEGFNKHVSKETMFENKECPSCDYFTVKSGVYCCKTCRKVSETEEKFECVDCTPEERFVNLSKEIYKNTGKVITEIIGNRINDTTKIKFYCCSCKKYAPGKDDKGVMLRYVKDPERITCGVDCLFYKNDEAYAFYKENNFSPEEAFFKYKAKCLVEKNNHILISLCNENGKAEYECGNCGEHNECGEFKSIFHNSGKCSNCQNDTNKEKLKPVIIKYLSDLGYSNFKYENREDFTVTCPNGHTTKLSRGSNSDVPGEFRLCGECNNERLSSSSNADRLNSDEGKKKSKQTCIKKYGAEHHMQNDEILEKTANTNLERYGVTTILQTETVHANSQKFNRTNKQIKLGSRTITVQGYEDKGIKYLLETEQKDLGRVLLEDDIVAGQGEIEPFWFKIDNKQRKYTPDIKIKNTNIYYEVKSTSSLNDRYKLLCKVYRKFAESNILYIILYNGNGRLIAIWRLEGDKEDIIFGKYTPLALIN